MQRWLIIIILLATTGCNSSLVQLQKYQPSGSSYQTYLAREYLDFAEAEADQYDWFDSAHFARKGLKLAKGTSVEPEDLRDWDINKETLPTLMQARQYLTETLDDNMKTSHPKEAAKAQFFFDCWVEQQEEDWQEKHIAFCREHFYNTLDQLYVLAENDKNDKTEKLMAKATPELRDTKDVSPPVKDMMVQVDKIGDVKPEEIDDADINLSDYADHIGGEYVCVENCTKTTEKRTLYFDFNSAKLSDRVKRVLNNTVSRLKDVEKYEINLNGYADRVGKEEYNMELSKKRADAVKKELVALGLKADSIMIYAFGEVHGLLETDDEVPEKENRAVEIVIEM